MDGFKGRSGETSSEAMETIQGRENSGGGLGCCSGGDEKWLDSGNMGKGEPIGIAGRLGVGCEIRQGFGVGRRMLFVAFGQFCSKDFLSTCSVGTAGLSLFWEALGKSLEGKLNILWAPGFSL